jgi:hypothetical protein
MVVALSQCFSTMRTRRLVRIEGKMNGAKDREIFNEIYSRVLRTSDWGRRFTFKQENNLKHTAKTTQEWLWDKSLNVLE